MMVELFSYISSSY